MARASEMNRLLSSASNLLDEVSAFIKRRRESEQAREKMLLSAEKDFVDQLTKMGPSGLIDKIAKKEQVKSNELSKIFGNSQ